MPVFQVGQEITDSNNLIYKIQDAVGSGGFGTVFRVIAEDSGKIFAMKTIATDGLCPDEQQALLNEGELAPQVSHDNVNKVHSFTKSENGFPPYLIMDYAEDGTLLDVLRLQRTTGKFFELERLKEIFRQIVLGVRAVNQNLIHRDLKPDNILVHHGTFKISDFGLSKIVGAATRSKTFKGIQHIQYMPPEAWNLDTNEIQMDMYSVGIIFYELATLKHPYSVPGKREHFVEWRDAHLFDVAIPADKHNSHLPVNIGW